MIAGIIQETPTPKGGRFCMHTTSFTTISFPRIAHQRTKAAPSINPARAAAVRSVTLCHIRCPGLQATQALGQSRDGSPGLSIAVPDNAHKVWHKWCGLHLLVTARIRTAKNGTMLSAIHRVRLMRTAARVSHLASGW